MFCFFKHALANIKAFGALSWCTTISPGFSLQLGFSRHNQLRVIFPVIENTTVTRAPRGKIPEGSKNVFPLLSVFH